MVRMMTQRNSGSPHGRDGSEHGRGASGGRGRYASDGRGPGGGRGAGSKRDSGGKPGFGAGRNHPETARERNRAQAPGARSRSRRTDNGPCPVMRACGGCTWLNLPYRKQLARKQAAMEQLFAPLFERVGWDAGIDPIVGMGGSLGDAARLASPRAFRYKAATPFAPGPRGQVRCGFFARGTHDIVAVPDCAVEAPGARRILNEVARAAQDCRIPAYDEDARRGVLRYAVLRLGWRSDEGILTLVTTRREIPGFHAFIERLRAIDPRVTTIAQNINPRVTNAILGGETRVLAGPPRMRDKLLSCTFEISPTAFYQTNPQQTEVLYQLAIDGMGLLAGDVLLDAYCGSGTIGLCAAQAAEDAGHGITLLGVERNPAGIEDARRNAEVNGLADTARFVAEDATAYMRRAAEAGEHVDVLAMDPPRAGSTPEFLTAAVALAPRCIVYISCNPVTQVRDLEQLAHGGYRLARLTPVDMFPHTEHVETVAVLERG